MMITKFNLKEQRCSLSPDALSDKYFGRQTMLERLSRWRESVSSSAVSPTLRAATNNYGSIYGSSASILAEIIGAIPSLCIFHSTQL